MSSSRDRAGFDPKIGFAIVGIFAVVGSVGLVFLRGQTPTILSTVGGPIVHTEGDTTGDRNATDPTTSNDDDAAAGSDVVEARAVVDASRPDLLVIRTGTISLQVDDVGQALDAATRHIETVGGYISASKQTGDESGLTATVTYRVPAKAWDDVLDGFKALATTVVSIKTHTEDVTAQVVDLRARIANLRVTEAALQGIMAKATKTSDVLDVQTELTTVRGEIERSTAQKQGFEDQAAFSTLTARFGLKPVPAVVATQNGFDPQSEVDKAAARLVRVVQRGITAGIWFAIVWLPILLVLGAVVGVVGVLAVRARRAMAPTLP